jgi:hypothetical protein
MYLNMILEFPSRVYKLTHLLTVKKTLVEHAIIRPDNLPSLL